MSFDLVYKAGVDQDDLAVNECCVRQLVKDGAPAGWGLWFVILREDNGKQELCRVSVNPNGPAGDVDGRHVWGLTHVGNGVWQVSPSIHYWEEIVTTGRVVDIWHQTPSVIGVPATEPWC